MIENKIEILQKYGSIFTKEEVNLLKTLSEKSNDDKINELEQIVQKFIYDKKFGVKHIDIGMSIGNFKTIIQVPKTNKIRVYDIASITKFFTLKLIYDLLEQKHINMHEKISFILPFKYMQNCTIEDIIKMKNLIETKGKLSDTTNKEEFNKRIFTAKYTVTNEAKYTDVGFVILTKILEHRISELCKSQKTYKEIFNYYIRHILNLENTLYVPTSKYEILGNGSHLNMPHDPKTRINEGYTCAAGLFSTAEDFIKISDLLFNDKFFNQKFLNEIYNYNVLDEKIRKRSYAGIYLKTDNNDNCYIPNTFTSYSIAHQGFTGSIVVFDLFTKVHFSILVDAINKKTDEKSKTFFEYLHELKRIIGLYCLSIYMSN